MSDISIAMIGTFVCTLLGTVIGLFITCSLIPGMTCLG